MPCSLPLRLVGSFFLMAGLAAAETPPAGGAGAPALANGSAGSGAEAPAAAGAAPLAGGGVGGAGTGAGGDAPASAPVPAPVPRKYVPGCLAKIFILPADTEWPPKGLPKAPAEVVRLPSIPTLIYEQMAKPPKEQVPTIPFLVDSRLGVLDGVRFYAVAFEGWIYAPQDGEYAFVVRSDDPYVLTIASQEVLRSGYFLDFSKGLRKVRDSLECDLPADVKWTHTTQGTVRLSGGRYYPFSLVAYQQHGDYNPTLQPSPIALRAMGTELLAAWTTPEDESSPIPLFVPERPAKALGGAAGGVAP